MNRVSTWWLPRRWGGTVLCTEGRESYESFFLKFFLQINRAGKVEKTWHHFFNFFLRFQVIDSKSRGSGSWLLRQCSAMLGLLKLDHASDWISWWAVVQEVKLKSYLMSLCNASERISTNREKQPVTAQTSTNHYKTCKQETTNIYTLKP